jgi:hypothetical protein
MVLVDDMQTMQLLDMHSNLQAWLLKFLLILAQVADSRLQLVEQLPPEALFRATL